MACDREGSQYVSRSPCNAFTYPDGKSTGKTKWRWTCFRPKSKERLQSPDNSLNLQVQCCWWFQKCDWLLSGWTEAQKVSSTTAALISSVSCPVVDPLIVFPLLICGITLGALPAHIYPSGLHTSTERSGCAPLLICVRKICQHNGNLYWFFMEINMRISSLYLQHGKDLSRLT